MKIYSKYKVFVILVPIEIISLFMFSSVGIENLLALWGGIYVIRFYRQFFDFERVHSIHKTPGLNISGVSHNPAYAMLRIEELVKIESHERSALKNLKIKLFYLSFAIVHFTICIYLIKFAS